MNNHFYVYVYLDPRKPGEYQYGYYSFDYESFYVGKGTERRYKRHLWDSTPSNKCFKSKIKKIQRETGNDPIIRKLKDELLSDVACNLEIDMIEVIGRRDLQKGPLLNMTSGGDNGNPGHIQTEEWQRKIIEKTAKIYDVITPTGETFTIKNLAKFCRENNLNASHMTQIAKKKKRYTNKGWKCNYGKQY